VIYLNIFLSSDPWSLKVVSSHNVFLQKYYILHLFPMHMLHVPTTLSFLVYHFNYNELMVQLKLRSSRL
jgi:hypothetical protein